MRQTDKANELERQVSGLRQRHAMYMARVQAKHCRVEQLIGFRQPLRNLINSANNALMCSMMYSSDSFRDQLTHVKSNLMSLAVLNERIISSRFTTRHGETANAATKLLKLSADLPLAVQPEDGYTGFVSPDGKVVPVYRLSYHGLPDVSGFMHSEYNIWFKSAREFSTGFIAWPTDENWNRVGATRDLLPAIYAALVEDGLAKGKAQ